MILKALAVGPFMSNCYVVGAEDTKEGMIIDPGAEPDTIMKAVEEAGLTINIIVATHTHIDHVGAAAEVKKATGAEYAVHEAERGTPDMGSMLAGFMGIKLEPPPKPDRLLRGGDTIELGDLKFTVLHTPGHSLGGISLWMPGVVFCGDTLFNFGIGRTDFPGCSFAQLMNSIFTKLMVLPDHTEVYSGHGPETTIGTERQYNPFLRMHSP